MGLNFDWRPMFGFQMKNVAGTMFSHHSWFLTHTHTHTHSVWLVLWLSDQKRKLLLVVCFSVFSFHVHM